MIAIKREHWMFYMVFYNDNTMVVWIFYSFLCWLWYHHGDHMNCGHVKASELVQAP